MKGFEFAKQFDTIEEKMIVLFMDAAKTAYNMAGMDFDSLPEQEKMDIVYKMMTRKWAANNRPQIKEAINYDIHIQSLL